MCIRDSVSVHAHADGVDEELHLRDPDIVAGGGVNGDGAGAVSYTHLRAHETVLDIVCRLLLEKKKEW